MLHLRKMADRKKYKHLFFDLDHTLWDFETNSHETLREVYFDNQLDQNISPDFDAFYDRYSYHNKRLWDRYNHGFIRQDELRWKRMWHTLLEYKNGDEKLAKKLSGEYLLILPHKKALFPHALEIIGYLQQKNYVLHLITNGFEEIQWGKLRNSGIDSYFQQVITSERAMALKPHKEIFEYALLHAKASKQESIMLGDNLDADIGGAMRFGMDTVFVNHIGEKTEVKPTFTISHLQELEQIF